MPEPMNDVLPRPAKQPSPVGPPLPKRAPRVFIVDDDPVTVRLLKKLVEDIDPRSEVAVAFHGDAVGPQLNLFEPDLVLLDLMLPGLHGFDLCKILRTRDPERTVRIIAISALPSRAAEKDILARGADRFLQKPIDVRVLRKTIVEILNLGDAPSA